MADWIVEAKGVGKSFGSFEALCNLDLEVKAGECVGLLGPNGAGKSTFISTLYGATRRSVGSLKVFGLDPNSDSQKIKQRLGVVTQENALDEGLSVIENMQLYGRFVGIHGDLARERILELLKYLNLEHKTQAPIRALSGGMKRRLAFVRALLSDPELIVLDEPTTGLDPAVRHLLWEKVLNLRGRGKTILLTTHYIHEAEVLCDRIVILNQGKVIEAGSPRTLIAKHTPGFVALFAADPSTETRLKSAVENKKQWAFFEQGKQLCLRAPELESLIALQQSLGLQPLQLRPSNLEDVFLKLTGEGLSSDS